jgi:hypothetical protein
VKIDIKTILIVILGIALLLTNMCSGDKTKTNKETIKIGGKKYELLSSNVDTQYVPVEKIVLRPGKTIYKDTTIYLPIPLSVDTMNILRSYFAKNVYIDTLQLSDSLGFLVVTDTLHQNSIYNRLWYTKINKVTINDKKVVKELPKNQFFVGFNTNVNKVDIVGSAGVITTLKTKDDRMYNLGIGLMNTSNGVSPYIGGGMQWKIKLTK